MTDTNEVPDIIPLHHETITVSVRDTETSRVRVETKTTQEDVLVREPLTTETVNVERVPIGRIVDAPPSIRTEGEYTIIPVVEEVLRLERRLLLKEEIRIRKVSSVHMHEEMVTLRKENVIVTRREP